VQELPSVVRHRSQRIKYHYSMFWMSFVQISSHKRAIILSILSQINPVHAPPSCCLKVQFNIVLPSMRKCPSGLFPSSFHQNPVCTPSPPPISSWLGHSYNIWWAVQIATVVTIQCAPVPSYLILLRPQCKSSLCEKRNDKTGNIRIDVTLRRVRVIIVAVEKQYVLHTLSVCL
jgi:hypothetical protein